MTRKWIVLFESSAEYDTTLPGLINIHRNGFPTRYSQILWNLHLPHIVLRPSLRHYYNPGALYIPSVDARLDLEDLRRRLRSLIQSLVIKASDAAAGAGGGRDGPSGG